MMKVGEQALYLAQLKGLTKKDALEKLKYWFKRFDITEWWDRKVEELSKGMQQKVQFIVTVLHEPSLLIFDEPFSGFDPINANLIKEEILRLKANGATVIFSTHNMESVEELCDHIALINKSNKILDGNVKDIRKQHKSNKFKIEFSGDVDKLNSSLGNKFELIEKLQEDDIYKLIIKASDNILPNELLQHIILNGQVYSFNEIIPSMNDIFIQNVKDDENNN